MATWYAQNTNDINGNGSGSSTIWYSTRNGSGGSWAAWPLTTTDTYDLNGYATNAANGETFTCATLQDTTGTGSGPNTGAGITVAGTLAITGYVTYGLTGTTTTSMIVGGAGTAITITGQVTQTSTGTVVYSQGAVTLTNSGATAVAGNGSNNTVINISSGSGALNVTGNIVLNNSSCVGPVITLSSTSASHNISGNLTGTAGFVGYRLVTQTAGTLAYSGTITVSLGANGIYVNGSSPVLNVGTVTMTESTTTGGNPLVIGATGGTINFIGSYTQAASTECHIKASGGTLNFATAGGALAVSNSGKFCVEIGGTVTITYTASGHTMSIVNTSGSAIALGLGTSLSPYVTGPTIGHVF